MWQARQAQIDATLCFLTTLSLYGLLRHLLARAGARLVPRGWAAAGLGVITKGVGFLPLLHPRAVRAARPAGLADSRPDRLAGAGRAAVHAGGDPASGWCRCCWRARRRPELAAYRDEILFQQTVTRYAEAWHHNEPFWYYLVSVVPALWLPLIALVPWLWSRWRTAIRERDTMVVALLSWVVIVVLFFSSSSGKRGVYVLPAVPALVMAAAPWLPELLRARGPRRLAFALASLLTGLIAAVAITLAVDPSAAVRLAETAGAQPLWPLAVMAAAAAIALAVFRVRDGWLAYGGVLAAVLVTTGLAIYPRIDAVRSCRAFMARVEQASADIPELGLAGAKEQYLLQARRPVTTFGHARWWEKEVEAADAAAWLAAGEGRGVLIGSVGREACFSAAEAADVGRANREHWFVVTGPPDPDCVARGDLGRASVTSRPARRPLDQPRCPLRREDCRGDKGRPRRIALVGDYPGGWGSLSSARIISIDGCVCIASALRVLSVSRLAAGEDLLVVGRALAHQGDAALRAALLHARYPWLVGGPASALRTDAEPGGAHSAASRALTAAAPQAPPAASTGPASTTHAFSAAAAVPHASPTIACRCPSASAVKP